MLVPLIRLLSDWATDATTGVNAQLPFVPRAEGEEAPPPVQHYNQLDHAWAARAFTHRDAFRDPNTNQPSPGLIIRHVPPENGFTAAVLPEFLQEDPTIVPITLLYGVRKIEGAAGSPATAAIQVRDGFQTLRTVHRIIAQHFTSSHTRFVRDDCVIQLPKSGLVWNAQLLDADSDEMIAALVVPFTVLDRWALGIT